MVRWREQVAIPERIGALTVQRVHASAAGADRIRRLDAEVAGPVEQAFAAAGHYVVTNTRNHRMDANVPLLVPEANSITSPWSTASSRRADGSGAILANPNCSTAALVLALAPLHRAFGIEKLFV